jgi:hypothetical protein
MKMKAGSLFSSAAVWAAALGALAPRVMGYGDHNNYPYAVHPGFTVSEVNIPMISDMSINWLSNGNMVLTTCETAGNYGGGGIPNPNPSSGVFLVGNVTGSNLTVKQIASMFRQPTGAVVVKDVIYVCDRDGFYKINSLSPSDITANRSLVVEWPKEAAPANFSNGAWNNGYWHQFVFCPIHYNGRFYAPYSGTIKLGGASDNPPSTSFSGAFLSWSDGGSGGFERIAGGFRSPNGANIGPGGMMMVSDNQGSWEPSCPLDLVRSGRFYGHRQDKGYAPNFAQAANDAGTMPYDPPVAWLLDGGAPSGGGPGQSASQPLYLDRGPYAGDWIIGDNNSKGISRVTLDPVTGSGVSGQYNGSVTFFTNGFGSQGSEAGVNRLALHPSGNIIYVGTLGTLGNWPTSKVMPFYAVRIDSGKAAASFEIRAVRSRQDGIEIDFTAPVDPATAVAGSFALNQYQLKRQDAYGAGNDEIAAPSIGTVLVSDDGRRVFLQLGNVAAVDRVLKIAASGIRSASGSPLFFNEAYFTHNYQSHKPFEAGITALRNGPSGLFMDNHVTCRLQAGSLTVEVGLAGSYRVSLHTLGGALLEDKAGSGPASFTFTGAGRHGLRVLQVVQGKRTILKPVFL